MIGKTCYSGLSPRTLHVGRRIDEASVGIACEKYVELTAPMSDGSSPLALPVAIAAFHVKIWIVIELRYHIRAKFPVHQVLALENGDTRQHVHRSRYEIESVAHLNDVGVGHIGP